MWASRDTQSASEVQSPWGPHHKGHYHPYTGQPTIPTFTTIPSIQGCCLGSERHRSAISDSESEYKQTSTEKEVKGLPTEPLGTLSMHGDKKGDGVGGREAGRMAGREPEGISTQENLTQPVEHHRQGKMRVWGEVTRFDVSMVSLEVEC